VNAGASREITLAPGDGIGHEIARRIDRAFRKVLSKRKMVTRDLGGKATTDEMGRAINDSFE
jgi:isocitrate/isopropylmalate dehydrogenase